MLKGTVLLLPERGESLTLSLGVAGPPGRGRWKVLQGGARGEGGEGVDYLDWAEDGW